MARNMDNRPNLLIFVAVFVGTLIFSPTHAQETYSWTFDAADAPNWTAVSGNWTVEGGEYSGTKGLADGPWNDGATYVNAANFSDFAYEARFRVVDGIGANKIWGLVFRANQSYRGYLFEFISPSELNLYRLNPGWTAAGGWNTLQSSTTPSINLGDWHTLRVVAEGPSIKGYFDGNLQVSVNDSSYAYGNVGLRALNGAHVHFDNVTVTTMTATPTPTPTSTVLPTQTPTPVPTITPTQTPNATVIPTVNTTATPTTTATPVITPVQNATATPTPNATITATFTPSPTSTSTSTPVPTVTATQTRTPCPQVPTWAVNLEGKNCREFSSPCDVPRNWIVVSSCPTAANETSGQQCQGCLYADSCIPFGTRLGPQYSVVPFNGSASYCDASKKAIEPQKNDTSACQNNYECISNYCTSGVCGNLQKELSVARGLLEQILDFLRRLFGFKPFSPR